ncbi:pyrimidine dimer DNA glycosylase [Alteromonas phage vB_AcoS-R7M]|uniref:Pyrimidine dimer DNA glycosylase n=1 Tax=Alteromonas phage vB_AcoS-R7M TaxID=2729541 RepID=A0A6M3YN41_9CAUD|nr:endonuclease V N-glycosylase UV repair enzyme [Alteromonas phage vB_AcoS-R7M]QJI53333.1 pyrimidine dimer DNA glycosylase [Alteromonas phage vB_AcoS-R7M]
MRTWMVPVEIMCRKHLQGEHVECHMFASSLHNNKSVKGFIEDGLFDPKGFEQRHEDLANEMVRRGGKHESPLNLQGMAKINLKHMPEGCVDVNANIKELARRCTQCYERIEASQYKHLLEGIPKGGDAIVPVNDDYYVQLSGQLLTEERFSNRDAAVRKLEKLRRNMTLRRQGRL